MLLAPLVSSGGMQKAVHSKIREVLGAQPTEVEICVSPAGVSFMDPEAVIAKVCSRRT